MNSENEGPLCRICYCEEGESEDEKFISPCCCTGEQLFVHKTCFSKWINSDINANSYSKCPTCACSYKRSSAEEFNDSVERNTLISILTIESGMFVLLLFLILGCSVSNRFLLFAIFILYLLSILYICGHLRYENCFWLIVIIYFCILGSKRDMKLFFSNMWLILLFSICSIHLVTETWDIFKSHINKGFLKSFKAKFYDYHLKCYVECS